MTPPPLDQPLSIWWAVINEKGAKHHRLKVT
jgi:hypothetical protein